MARTARAVVTAGAALAALGAAALASGSPALADPIGGAFRTYVGVGSDTTQSVVNGIAGDVTGVTGTTKVVASYDAFPSPGTIKTRATGPTFDRPSGSGNGVKALSDALTGTPWGTTSANVTGQIDFARSSAGPAVAGTSLTYVPFARDAVSYAYKGSAATLGKLTTAQLNTIYSSNTPVTINGIVVHPKLPQSASGTRKFFLAAIGVTTVGASVNQTTLPENDGSILTASGDIVPFSAAQWIGQRNGLVTNTTAGKLLGSPNAVAPTKTVAGKLTPNTTFYNGAFGRDVYNVIPTSKVTAGVGKLFVGTASTFCKTATQTVVKQFGFATIGTRCGTTGVTGGLTP